MKKRRYILSILLAAIFLTGCNGTKEMAILQSNKEKGVNEIGEPDESATEEFGQTEEIAEPSIMVPPVEEQEKSILNNSEPVWSDMDIRKQELALELRWNTYEELRGQSEQLDSLEQGLNGEKLQELVQSELLKCYEENTLLAVEIKTVVLGSLGCNVPTGFATGKDVMSNYVDYLKGDLGKVIDEVASPQVRDVLQNGVEGSISAYHSSGNLEDALAAAASSLKDGVIAGIQEEIKNYAVDVMDQTTGGLYNIAAGIVQAGSLEDYITDQADQYTGGLVDSLNGILNYDSTPGALLQSLSDSAGKSAETVKAFLDQNTITSTEINAMMYQYSLFGSSLEALSQYGAVVNFDWRSNYNKMEILYKMFRRNEIMIEMLSVGGDSGTSENIGESAFLEVKEKMPQIQYIYEKPVLPENSEMDNNEKYDFFASELEKMESACTELRERLEKAEFLTACLKEYQCQIEEINQQYGNLIHYSVQNFQPFYDTAGIQGREELNSINNAIGEISKYSPYGIWINMIASMNIAGGDAYYDNMQAANESFSKAYQETLLTTREALTTLEIITNFYSELVADQNTISEKCNNIYLLKYILGDSKIDIEEYIQPVRKELYLLAAQADAMEKVYKALYLDQTAANAYKNRYKEIMNLIDPDGTGMMTEAVTREELAQATQPILEAGVSAIMTVGTILDAPNIDNRYIMLYANSEMPGKVCCCFGPTKRLIRVRHEKDLFDICLSEGEPLYVRVYNNGYYIYDGLVLNGPDNMDDAAVCSEAKWIEENVWNDTSTFNSQCRFHFDVLYNALNR